MDEELEVHWGADYQWAAEHGAGDMPAHMDFPVEHRAKLHSTNLLVRLNKEHVNLTGDYVWGAQSSASENTDGLRPLRMLPEAYLRVV